MKNRRNNRIINTKTKQEYPKESILNSSIILNTVILLFLCVLVGYLNYHHVSYMQEKNVMFSHLSNLERELSFRTEMGFYYSFYKQVIHAPTFSKMINLLVHDNLTEYPDSINALQRFNVYPELIVGIMYKYFIIITNNLGIQTRTCYMVNREDLPSVESCEGLGEPAIFYVNVVMLINGAMMSIFFLIGYFVSDGSYLGGIITSASYFFNHRECTRVQWTPPLRESFSYPFLVIQQFFLLTLLKKPYYFKGLLLREICFVITTLVSLLSWQFAQFALLTQCMTIFLAYLITGDDFNKKTVSKIYILLIIADVANLILQFGNTLLLTGPLRPCLIMAYIIITFEPLSLRNRFQNCILSPLRWIVLLLILFTSTALLKYLIALVLNIKSDDHMFDILLSKFSKFRSFDSLLYTCAPEFDFYDISSIYQLCLTGLFPIATFTMLITLIYLLYKWIKFPCLGNTNDSINQITISGLFSINECYLFFQTSAYIVMASLIMRLKLFATPQLCIMTALICHKKWPLIRISEVVTSKLLKQSSSSSTSPIYKKIHLWPIVLILAICSVKGMRNLREEWAIQGSYSNWEQEQLMNYIIGNTNSDDSFTGQMATMATVRLVTGRPIIVHPHYEDEGLRKRVHTAYSVYSKKSIKEVWWALRSELQAKYLVYEHAHCNLKPFKPGCSYQEMWDIKDPINASRDPICILFDEFVRSKQMNRYSDSSAVLNVYFKWKFTSENVNYSLFEVMDVPH